MTPTKTETPLTDALQARCRQEKEGRGLGHLDRYTLDALDLCRYLEGLLNGQVVAAEAVADEAIEFYELTQNTLGVHTKRELHECIVHAVNKVRAPYLGSNEAEVLERAAQKRLAQIFADLNKAPGLPLETASKEDLEKWTDVLHGILILKGAYEYDREASCSGLTDRPE